MKQPHLRWAYVEGAIAAGPADNAVGMMYLRHICKQAVTSYVFFPVTTFK